MKEEFGAILRMRATEVEADNEPGVEQVLAYLDDPANSDVFVEVARYQRAVE